MMRVIALLLSGVLLGLNIGKLLVVSDSKTTSDLTAFLALLEASAAAAILSLVFLIN